MFRWGGRYKLSLGTFGDQWLMASSFDGAFLIDVGRRTLRCVVRDRNDAAWLDVLVRRVLPRVAILFGATAIHGAAVARHGGALLMLGESGAGKSTLSAALGLAGWDVLSDDISILWDSAAPKAAPATTGICVWPDTRIALKLPEDRCVPMPGYDDKTRFVPGTDVGIVPITLKGLVFLARSPDVREPILDPISGAEAMGRTSQQRIRFNPTDPEGSEMLTTFAALGAIVRATPSYRLSYPKDYRALPETAERLRALVEL